MRIAFRCPGSRGLPGRTVAKEAPRKRWIPIAALLAAASPLGAQVIIEVCLGGTQVIPSVLTTGSGQAALLVDQVGNIVTLSGAYTNLSSDVVSADLIFGEVDINGGIVFVPITNTGGTWKIPLVARRQPAAGARLGLPTPGRRGPRRSPHEPNI